MSPYVTGYTLVPVIMYLLKGQYAEATHWGILLVWSIVWWFGGFEGR